jgi:hypothetical protein
MGEGAVMAKARRATFSVADHLNFRALVPDVLLFDRLVFPCPADEAEEARWSERGWDPEKLNRCLLTLEELAYPVEWGKTQNREFDSNMEQAANLERLILSPLDYKKKAADAQSAHEQWQSAKAMTREMLESRIKAKGGDYWVMPRYGSKTSFLKDQNVSINPADKDSRRDALALLVSQKMSVPDDADEVVALRLAINLARDQGYQRHRRALFDWQESVIQRDQTMKEDAQDLADLIADLNRYIASQGSKERSQWIVFVLKRIIGIPELVHPLGALNTAVEVGEFVSDRGREMAPGAMAAFRHVRERVIEASDARGAGR